MPLFTIGCNVEYTLSISKFVWNYIALDLAILIPEIYPEAIIKYRYKKVFKCLLIKINFIIVINWEGED